MMCCAPFRGSRLRIAKCRLISDRVPAALCATYYEYIPVAMRIYVTNCNPFEEGSYEALSRARPCGSGSWFLPIVPTQFAGT